ncbi:hypothetical protein [Rhodovulum sulfidophilum]|uniref:hypothetical protein n=1 Tax=Rhodovulum sulfidophilum TaxID=35806 RepID=UPI0019223FF0|nr:hypothetical protein [Rhodovulum sulfidophilum]MBL3563018.1 hypothetical protein [Rhodovulum sulfidophilum]
MSDPWLKFYTSDWRSDPGLRMCGLAARGLWVEMICLMHEATPYGHLLVNGQSPTDAQLGVLVGAAPDQITAMLGELEAAGVFSRTRAGVIYSRKLTRMAKKAATARNNGRRGGNPTLSKGKGNPVTDNPPDKGRDKPQKPEARVQKREDTNVSLSPGDDLGFHPVDEISEAVAAFNVAASESGWPQIRVLSKARRSALKARLAECGGLDGWHAALHRAQSSPHCCGQNDRGWVANFDFLTRQSSFAKLMEGNYDNRSGGLGPATPGRGGPGSGLFDACAAVAARRAGRA